MNCQPVFCICSWYKVVLTQRRSQFIVRTDLTEFGQILRRCTTDFSPVVICHNVELTYKAANICRKCEPSATYSSSTRRQTPDRQANGQSTSSNRPRPSVRAVHSGFNEFRRQVTSIVTRIVFIQWIKCFVR